MKKHIKVLQLAALDVTVSKLLLPLIDRLSGEGYEVHVACSDGEYVPGLRARGYIVHSIPIERRISLFSNLVSLWRIYRLVKKEHFDIVHVHTPLAAALGRMAARAAGVPLVIYTAHGFYFHDGMAHCARRLIIAAEKILGHVTDLIFTQSEEDAANAVKENICARDKVLGIGNGVNLARFSSRSNGARSELGFGTEDRVVGFVGRIVSEKGVLELIDAFGSVVETLPTARLLMVGDTLDSDRDSRIKKAISDRLDANGLASHVLFTGLVEDVAAMMSAMDIFVLPSYREGMPRTVIEAMASGKPVVATNIRGCREEVVPGSTGLLVPPRDSAALATAITTILADPVMARRMGEAGLRRAKELFDERLVLDRQVKAYARIIDQKFRPEFTASRKPVQRSLKRGADILVSLACSLLLSVPFLVTAALIKIESPGPVFFRQERVGKDGKMFHVWKFRTMIDGAVNHGLGLNVAHNDPRLTRVGRVLRNWGLDELPQLINVLTGEMSLIGPRPTLHHQVEQYTDFQRQRLSVKPGISSLAVVKGRNSLSWQARIRLDVWYVRHWSLWLDILIVFRTFWSVLVTRKGIYGPDGINDDLVPISTAPAGIDDVK